MSVDRAHPRRDGSVLATVIVGAGLMGRFHADAVHRAGSRITGVVDGNGVAGECLARAYPGSVAGISLGDVLSQTLPDIVHVCTPDTTHYALALEIAAAGAHALIEKPLVPTVAETTDVLARFRSAGTFVIPTHQYAFQLAIDQTVARISRIGPLRRITFDIRSAGGLSAESLDRAASTILPHPLSIVQRFLPGAEIGAADWTFSRASPGEWLVTAVIEGVQIVTAISMNGRPTRFATSLLGEGGTIDIDNFNGFATLAPASASRLHKVSGPFRDAARQFGSAGTNLAGRIVRRELGYVGLRSLIAAFHAAVRSGDARDLPITPTQIMANAVACANVGEAARG